jgi:phosphate transport system substrate-binding protein
MTNGDLDFGATDAPMSPDELKAAGGEEAVVHVPLVMGAVAIVYNVKGKDGQPIEDLKLSGELLARIFLDKELTKWNDDAIKELQPKEIADNLPDETINPVYRADGSGTSFIFSTYLSEVSKDWAKKVGATTQLKLDKGQAIAKTGPVAQRVGTTEGAIGYVELTYALDKPDELKSVRIARIENADKSAFLKPSLEGVTAAAENKKVPEADLKSLRFSIVAAPGKKSYPISGTTWAVLKVKQSSPAKAQALKEFLTWAIKDGQKDEFVKELNYAPLPANVVKLAEEKIQTIGKE